MKLNKKQKRTATIASMAALLAVVLGMGGQTFAKYISTATTGSQTATVAKWGVVINTNITNFFGLSYEDTVLKTDKTGTDVKASASGKVVAPGTTGSMTFGVTGSPEVAAQVSFAATGTDVSLTHSGGTYNPIKWTLNDGSADLVSEGSLADVIAKINGLGKDAMSNPARVEVGTPLDRSYTLTWVWNFDNDPLSNVDDYRDAALGNFAAGKSAAEADPNLADTETYTSAVTSISFNLTINVEQVQ